MKNYVLKAAGTITLIAIVSKILGFGRELLMASYFGTSITSDAYFVASIIPVLLFTAVGMAITTGMVPLYAEAKKKGKEEASEIISVLSTLFLIGAVVITVICFFLTPFITKLMAPGFSDEQLQLTNMLTMIMLPSFCFYVLSAVTTGILEYEKTFAPPAFGAIPQNLLIIFAIIFLTNFYGIYGIAVATLLGAISQFFVQYPFIRKYKVLKLNFNFKAHKKLFKNTFLALSPIIIASIAYQLNAVVDRMIASGLQAGSVSALNYANKLMFLPLSIVLLSFITVLFPSIVDAAAEKSKHFVRHVFQGLSVIALIGIPITIVMLVESQTLVDLAYKRGAFDDDASLLTTTAFFFYTFGMIFIALKEFLNRCFIAIQATKVTMYASIASIVVNIILSIILSPYLGVGGIALATSIAMGLQTIFLFMYLPKKAEIEKQEMTNFLWSIGRLLLLFVIGYALLFMAKSLFEGIHPILSFLLSSAIAFTFTAIGASILKIPEMQWLTTFISSKIRRKKHG
ncbi:murein biosynthesis integral membrane protein MurJ [Cytobacillus purgationiresistens]|uniref:Probable lipid II flippase MurJ n=1 Tax=Cytobacillus purgationiresistens TaxID=863449 RepID=A0ABU0ACX8_9BACI|nr:murein biosynthesis integral membrane protein MurJ [Cytobacillus purgationiresistens]MDQ0269110.1 putative peptidoglycan lipid II flippase [Cytobacillus purgationiresistens]